MAKKSSSAAAAKLAVDLMFAPVSVAVGVGKAINKAHKAGVKERERQERLAVQEQKRRERAQRMAAAEARRIEAEKAKAAKLIAQIRAREEAEQARIRLAYASLEDRYQGAFARHAELLKMIESATDDLVLIERCKEDIGLIPMMYDYETRRSIIEKRKPVYPHFETFFVLSKVYERLNMYPQAILACQQGIDMGITKAEEGCTMEQRIEQLRSESRKKGAVCNGEV